MPHSADQGIATAQNNLDASPSFLRNTPARKPRTEWDFITAKESIGAVGQKVRARA
jgi:hypothetical protein